MTKEKLENFYRLKNEVPEYYCNRDPFLPEIQEILSSGFLFLLSDEDDESSRYFYFRCKPIDLSKFLFENLAKVCSMIVDVAYLENPHCSTVKQYVICDMEGTTMNHAALLTPTNIKNMVMCLQNGYPHNVQDFYLINCAAVYERILDIARPIMGKKLSKKIHIYRENSIDELCNIVPYSILPREYGGGGMSLNDLTEYSKKRVENFKDWFLEEDKYCLIENKRIKDWGSSDAYGVDGSFRKLSID
ncbi:hypothetical protein FQA39_LY14222 [Lamprigera yunnana]|nr:hypothetical protein FQA39_LY14222 [Lamprigera yunnana]